MYTSKITIIIPVYNAGDYLVKCLESVCGQTYTDLEIICVNGDSMDDSEKILKSYAQKDNRICVFNIENKGVSASRNFGLAKASGEYVVFVDADDWMDYDTCDIALKEAQKEKADVVMWSYVREFGDRSLPKNIFRERQVFEQESLKNLHRRFIGLLGNELQEVENADALCTVWGKLYRRELIERQDVRFIDLNEIGTYEDGMFNLQVFGEAKKAVFINRCMYHYRRDNNNSITSIFKPQLLQQWKRLFSYMEQYIDENKLPLVYREALKNRICLSVLGQGLNIWGMSGKRVRQIKEILSDTVYREAYKEFSLEYLPLHWKIFYGCAKYDFAIGVFVLLFCIQKIRGK